MFLFSLLTGAALLTFGKKCYWLFVATTGFLVTSAILPLILKNTSDKMVFTTSLVAGALGAILAIFLHKFALGLAGFLIGGFLASTILPGDSIPFLTQQPGWLIFIVGGLFGLIFSGMLFNWALIIITSITGAYMIIQTISLNPLFKFILLLLLVFSGALIQFKMEHKHKDHLLPAS